MAILDIARMGHSILKEQASVVSSFNNNDLENLIKNMKETMFHVGGVGLAAPQVYMPLRVVIFFVPADRNDGIEVPLSVLINPVITPETEEMDEDWEACLSVPGLNGVVPRWKKVKYTYQNIDGSLRERYAEGFHARVVQHECDHLDGILYPMRMIDLGTLSFIGAENADE
ncbi:MAG: peptide deformylase [Rhodospirillaceae bacterium]|nr:peptide deformylase [Rhodospirillaceae bacterium]